ncbi:MAG: S8 family serine peptidase [bacterium]|nr:S8 family serine peptidase [bacterium]
MLNRLPFLLLAALIGNFISAPRVSSSEFVPGELILKLKRSPDLSSLDLHKNGQGILTNLPTLDELNREFNVTEMRKLIEIHPPFRDILIQAIDLTDIYKLILPADCDLDAVAAAYQQNPLVEYAEPNYIRQTNYTPNDPFLSWGLTNIEAYSAWDITAGTSDVVIAVVDTGLDWDHPDLSDNIWINPGEIPDNGVDDDGNGFVDDYRGWDFTDAPGGPAASGEDYLDRDNDPMDFHGHGTHVAGIVAAVADNGIGSAGLAYGGKVMAVRSGYKTAGGSGWLEDDDCAAAIIYAADNGAKVINMSWGGPSPSSVIQDALNYAASAGCLLIAAAGNSSSSSPFYPAAAGNVLAVAATGSNDSKASFSNYGDWIDVSAPGTGIYSTLFDNTYASWSGTSMAAPFVAGLGGLIFSQNPDWDRERVAQQIKDTADNIDSINPSYAGLLGSGRINAYQALLPETQPLEIVRGPYLSSVTTNSIIINWGTNVSGDSRVDFGLTSAYDQSEYSSTQTTSHSLTLTGLETSTTYHYQATSQNGTTVSSQDRAFRTAPYSHEPLTFAAFGDTRTGHDAHQTLVNAIHSWGPDLVTNTGDLVNNGWHTSDWETFFEINRELMKEIPYYASIGNHEYYYETTCPLYFEYFAFPGNERWFSFDYGNSHFIFLDTNRVEWYETGTEQYNWLANDLAAHTNAEFTFVFFHQPPYSSSRHCVYDGYAPTMRAALCPLFEDYGVDIVFNGHDHNYERSLVNGVNYIVTGGGGGPLYGKEVDNDWSLVFQEVYHYCRVSVNGTMATMQAVDINGNVFDTLQIQHGEQLVCTITSPPEDTWLTGTVTISAEAAGPNDITRVEFGYSTNSTDGQNGNWFDCPSSPDLTAPYSIQWATQPAAGTDSTVWLRARAKDNSGIYSSYDTRLIKIDNQAPAFASWTLSPSDLTGSSSGPFTVQVEIVEAGSGLSGSVPQFDYRIDPGNYDGYEDMTSEGGSSWSYQIPEPVGGWASQIERTIHWRVRCSDVLGNEGISDEQAEFIEDDIAIPSLSIVLPADTLPAGSTFWANIVLGEDTNPVEDLQGLSFILTCSDPTSLTVMEPTEAHVLIETGSFLGPDLVKVSKANQANSEIRVGLSRKHPAGGATGYGRIARIKFYLSPGTELGSSISFTLSEVSAYKSNTDPILLSPQGAEVTAGNLLVWPGDTDNNGIVNEADILPIGQYWLMEGPARSGDFPVEWQGYSAAAWEVPEAAYADADGNGRVDEAEIAAIGLHWERKHPAPAPSPGRDILSLEIDHTGNLPAYRAMYRLLDTGQESGGAEVRGSRGEAIARMKGFLAQLIELGLKGQSPESPTLGQNYPNPLNPETYIPFSLSEPARVVIRIYNLSGQLIRALDLGESLPGTYISRTEAAYWDGKDSEGQEVSSGVYFYQLKAGDFVTTRRMIVLK